MLNTESTEVQVSDYLKNGGGSGDEWPWKVLKLSNLSSDKWIVESKTAWLLYRFNKPITIRGYGIISASDAEERDPKSWKFFIHDMVKSADPEIEEQKDDGSDD